MHLWKGQRVLVVENDVEKRAVDLQAVVAVIKET